MKKTIYKTILAATLSVTFTAAQAWPVIIDPLSGPNVDVVPTLSIFGACGGAIIQVSGINQKSFTKAATSFTVDGSEGAGIYLMAQGTATRIPVSDNNTVLCVPVGHEFRIVVGSSCGGSACSDAMNYLLIDPKTKKNTAPQMCDIGCASKLLKTDALKKMGLQ